MVSLLIGKTFKAVDVKSPIKATNEIDQISPNQKALLLKNLGDQKTSHPKKHRSFHYSFFFFSLEHEPNSINNGNNESSYWKGWIPNGNTLSRKFQSWTVWSCNPSTRLFPKEMLRWKVGTISYQNTNICSVKRTLQDKPNWELRWNPYNNFRHITYQNIRNFPLYMRVVEHCGALNVWFSNLFHF